ncbi:unnamed protein product [Brassicogethes aeneus]|uniref:Uncharacterized protein n=1 Tax=Brassicogethes aeneus TaxID=1431903 RepID=A0A9P0AWK1_BRAAE|nr:unnamed protein product [Brassicogethes aeneus]
MKPIPLSTAKKSLEVVYPMITKRLSSTEQKPNMEEKNQPDFEPERPERPTFINVAGLRKMEMENITIHADTWWKEKYIMRDIALKKKKWPVKRYIVKPAPKRTDKYKFP